MSIVELLEKVGSENISFQYLNECVQGADRRKNHVSIKFGTQLVTVEDVLHGFPDKICIVMVMPRDKYEAAFKETEAP